MSELGAVPELSDRWRRARRAAVAGVVSQPPRPDASEDDLVEVATEVDAVELHRRLFENSARLGEGFARFHRQQVTMETLAVMLPALGSPCLVGEWVPLTTERAMRLERTPCRVGCTASTCDAWRESIDGLVVGLTGGLRHTRQSSAGRGGAGCVDVVYEDPESPARFAPLPPDVAVALEPATRLVRSFKDADVEWLGFSEGVLLYRLDVVGCGGTDRLRGLLEETLKKRLPKTEVRELSPRPVLDQAGQGPSTKGERP